jgi:hypothetical protein
MNEKTPDHPVTVTVKSPIDVDAGDFVMLMQAGKWRREGWAMALSPDDIARRANDARNNPIYGFAAISSVLTRHRGSLADVKFSIHEMLFIARFANDVLHHAMNGDLSPTERTQRLATALGFTRKGWSAFKEFEGDGKAHFATHEAAQRQRNGERHEDAVLKASRTEKRSAQRVQARGKKMGAKPRRDKT